MDLIRFPRALLYEDRNNIDEFEIHKEDSFNSIIHREIQKIWLDTHNKVFRETELLDIFNDAYYLCVLLSFYRNPLATIEEIIDSVFANYTGKSDDLDQYKSIVLTVVKMYLLLGLSSIHNYKAIIKYLADKTLKIFNNRKTTAQSQRINAEEFKPRTITSDVLSNISWSEITDNFNLSKVHFCVDRLGSSNEEKKLVIESISKDIFLSDSNNKVPYEVNRYLSDRYNSYGGKKLREVVLYGLIDSIDLERFLHKFGGRNTKDDLIYRLTKVFGVSIKPIDPDREKLDSQNKDLVNENKSLKLSLTELQEQYRQLELKFAAHHEDQSIQETKKIELETLKKEGAEMKAKVKELNEIIQELQTKIGNETIPLNVIIEGIKWKARVIGLQAANTLFEQIDVLLSDVETWRINKIELKTFFEELAKPTPPPPPVNVVVKKGGVAQISEQEINNMLLLKTENE